MDEAQPFHGALLELNRKRLGTRIKLRRLDSTQTQDMLAAIFDSDEITGEFLEGIFGETEGNPFFIEEVCKALVESGQVTNDRPGELNSKNNTAEKFDKEVAPIPPPENPLEGMGLKQLAKKAARKAEREAILKVLEVTRWNKSKAAKVLKISYKALLYKIKDCGIDQSDITG